MRKIILGVIAAIAVAAIARGIWGAIPHGHPDYRDPVRLAKALKSTEHTTAASCGKIAPGKYVCYAANADGSSASYQVTVSPDGSTWKES